MGVDAALTRLASYGTLAPGRENHHQMAGLRGTWIEGTVRGRLTKAWRGIHAGLPGFVLDPGGDAVAVQVFTSPDLPAHWARLDAFEGEFYARVTATISLASGPVEAQIYVFTDEGS